MGYKDPVKQKEAQHEWYIKNKERLLVKQRQQRQERKELLHSLKNNPCMDCKIHYPPYVMDFDHREPSNKLFGVSDLGLRSMDKFLKEVSKCDLVCANCHRIRTHQHRKQLTVACLKDVVVVVEVMLLHGQSVGIVERQYKGEK